jgi:hypothetical protein
MWIITSTFIIEILFALVVVILNILFLAFQNKMREQKNFRRKPFFNFYIYHLMIYAVVHIFKKISLVKQQIAWCPYFSLTLFYFVFIMHHPSYTAIDECRKSIFLLSTANQAIDVLCCIDKIFCQVYRLIHRKWRTDLSASLAVLNNEQVDISSTKEWIGLFSKITIMLSLRLCLFCMTKNFKVACTI